MRTRMPHTDSRSALPHADFGPRSGIHTPGHIECPGCELARQRMIESHVLARLEFSAAAQIWLSSHEQRIAPQTVVHYENCIRALNKFFAQLPLDQIHIGHLEQYQAMRRQASGGLRRASAGRINQDLNALSQILQRAGLWAALAPYYKPLRLPRRARGIALEPDEEKHLFQVAASNSRWLVAYCTSLLSRNTCAGPGEIRHLRLSHLDTASFAWMKIEECVKNEFRIRTLALNRDAQWAVAQLLERAREKGSYAPEHYLLPRRVGASGFDPAQPQDSWKKAWNALRAEAGERFPRLAQMRFYDNRHTACTNLLDNPDIPYSTIEHYMGHRINSTTKRIYDHRRDLTIRLAAEALSSGHAERIAQQVPLRFVEAEKKNPQPAAGLEVLRQKIN